jgi:hypothetical protein
LFYFWRRALCRLCRKKDYELALKNDYPAREVYNLRDGRLAKNFFYRYEVRTLERSDRFLSDGGTSSGQPPGWRRYSGQGCPRFIKKKGNLSRLPF